MTIALAELQRPCVLIIDDEPTVRDVLRRMMEASGWRTIVAADGAEGMHCCRQETVDLVITDILMPRQEGIQTIIDLKRDFVDLPIIAISGGGRVGNPEHYLRDAKNFGAHATLAKPIRFQDLADCVRSIFSSSASDR